MTRLSAALMMIILTVPAPSSAAAADPSKGSFRDSFFKAFADFPMAFSEAANIQHEGTKTDITFNIEK